MGGTSKPDSDQYARLAHDFGDGQAVDLTLTIRLHRNGALSVEGPVADAAFCRRLLDEAWDAIKRQGAKPLVVTPAADVGVRAQPSYRTT